MTTSHLSGRPRARRVLLYAALGAVALVAVSPALDAAALAARHHLGSPGPSPGQSYDYAYGEALRVRGFAVTTLGLDGDDPTSNVTVVQTVWYTLSATRERAEFVPERAREATRPTEEAAERLAEQASRRDDARNARLLLEWATKRGAARDDFAPHALPLAQDVGALVKDLKGTASHPTRLVCPDGGIEGCEPIARLVRVQAALRPR